jgi:hypothetical protein
MAERPPNRRQAPRSAPSEAHHHTPSEEREIREAALDDTIEGTFPASDPASTVPNPDDHDAVWRRKRKRRASN